MEVTKEAYDEIPDDYKGIYIDYDHQASRMARKTSRLFT